jgi:peroxiredoxin
MKKLLILMMAICLPLAMFAQNKKVAKKEAKPAPKDVKSGNITLVCHVYKIPSTADSLILFDYAGMAMKPIMKGGRRYPDSAYVFTLPRSEPRFYMVGLNEGIAAKVLLGEEENVELWASYALMAKGRTSNSPANKGYEVLNQRLEDFRNKSEQIFEMVNLMNQGGGSKQKIHEEATKLSKAKLDYVDSLQKINPILGAAAAVRLSPDFKPENNDLAARQDHYGKNYFKFANFNNAKYEYLPDLFTSFSEYVNMLIRLNPPDGKMQGYIEDQLAKFNPTSRAHRLALGGAIEGLKAAEHPLYATFSTKYIQAYKSDSWGEVAPLEFEVRRSSTFMTGMEAPDLAGAMPDGNEYALSKMRGKIVLVDFWASWCGPCRRENPNVVNVYNKYKDKGFDILGVSLDSNGDAWKRAIEQDGLPWPHISDLKGWKSSHAQLYSINSIPQTVLVDKQGRILARNLRGESLEAKLKELFGE